MSNKLKLNTKDESLREILSNGKKYFVPKFQRDYAWEQEQWEILWEDIELLMSTADEYHYMGYLVLQESAKIKAFKIIDGQQRLTTFSLLVLAANKRLLDLGDEQERMDEFHKSFIGSKDLVKLQMTNKLKLNRNNDYHYNEAVQGNPLPQRGKKKTVHLMQKALAFFYKRFQSIATGEEIGKIIQTISDHLLFTTIYISDELNAYKVFETLNARGAQLSSGDLIKNYLFSVMAGNNDMPDEVFDRLDEKWEKIGEEIGDAHYTDYLLTAWNSTHKLVRATALFKNVRQGIQDKQEADDYLNHLANYAQLYAALLSPEHEYWKDEPNYTKIKQALSFLKLFNIRQPLGLLFIAYQRHREDFVKILNWIKVFSLRYNIICGEHTGAQEGLYNKICLALHEGCTLDDIKENILTLYPEDEKFKRDFTDKTFPTAQSNKKVRYLLARLEEFKGGSGIDESKLTVEHILPESPSNTWIDEFGDNYRFFSQIVGNMALVKYSVNKMLAQKPFPEKKAILQEKDTHRINGNIQEYEEWDEQAITSRQKEMAKSAAQLWRID